MNSTTKATIMTVCLFAVAAASGCPTSPVVNSPGNSQNVNSSIPKPAENVNNAVPTNTDVGDSSGSLATPTDAYNTAFAIRQRKDGQALKRVLSKEILEFFTEMGKVENKTLDDMLKELVEKPQSAKPEVRNEKITGNRAVLEYKDDKGQWKEMDFEKEGGEWKLTLPKAETPDKAPDGPGKRP